MPSTCSIRGMSSSQSPAVYSASAFERLRPGGGRTSFPWTYLRDGPQLPATCSDRSMSIRAQLPSCSLTTRRLPGCLPIFAPARRLCPMAARWSWSTPSALSVPSHATRRSGESTDWPPARRRGSWPLRASASSPSRREAGGALILARRRHTTSTCRCTGVFWRSPGRRTRTRRL